MKTIREVLFELKEHGSYVINKEENIVITREQIGEMITSNYEEAAKCLEENIFMEAFVAADPQMVETLHTLEGKYESSEQILFHLQYQLNPALTFSYKDLIYRDVATLGEGILAGKAEKAVVLEAMGKKLFSYYAKFKNFDAVRSDIIERIEFAENYITKNPEIAYHLLGYYLSERKYYKYEGHKFLSIVAFYTYLSNKKKLVKFSATMTEDYLFIAWLFCLGNCETYEKWLAEIARIDNMDYEVAHQK